MALMAPAMPLMAFSIGALVKALATMANRPPIEPKPSMGLVSHFLCSLSASHGLGISEAATPSAAKAWSRCTLSLACWASDWAIMPVSVFSFWRSMLARLDTSPVMDLSSPPARSAIAGVGGSMVAVSAIDYPVLTVTPPALFDDLPFNAAASVAMALPVLAACVVSLLTSVW